jgi:hypothetical protein
MNDYVASGYLLLLLRSRTLTQKISLIRSRSPPKRRSPALSLAHEFRAILPGCRLLDIDENLLEKGVSLKVVEGARCIYRDPCYSPVETYAPTDVARHMLGKGAEAVCCRTGEREGE